MRHQHLVTVDFDTPDLAMKCKGASLRVREADGRDADREDSRRRRRSLARGEWEDRWPRTGPTRSAAWRSAAARGIGRQMASAVVTEVDRRTIDRATRERTRRRSITGIRAIDNGCNERLSELDLELKAGARLPSMIWR